jgi:predicted DNA-binding transcriptional regulator YafY
LHFLLFIFFLQIKNILLYLSSLVRILPYNSTIHNPRRDFMRADRLLSLLMLLQTRGRMTAEQLSDELEVSIRTIYRDLDALSAAGIPVYAERGPGGGCALVDNYRTHLTGMTEDEVRALFMLSIPTPLAKLGLSQQLKAALLKLSASLPPSQQQDEAKIRQRFYLDSNWWFQSEEPTPFLAKAQQAVWEDRRLLIIYRLRYKGEIQRMVDPYGLVAKAGIWYLLFKRDGRFRILRISELLDAEFTNDFFRREADFDLADCWKMCCDEYEKNRPTYPVCVRVSPDFIDYLPHFFGDPIREKMDQAHPPDTEGWIQITLPFESLEAARDRILGFGRAVEVLDPEPLRRSIIDYAKQIAQLYTDS